MRVASMSTSNWLKRIRKEEKEKKKKRKTERQGGRFFAVRWRAVHEDPVTFRLTSSVKLENKRAASWCSQLAARHEGLGET